MRSPLMGLFIALVAAGCKGKGGSPDTWHPQDDTGDSGGAHDSPWTVEQVSDEDMGQQVRITELPDGTSAIAAWANSSYTDGTCSVVTKAPPPLARVALWFATTDGSTWSTEHVDDPIVLLTPTGLALDVDPDGNPTVAYAGGDPEPTYQFCGGHDAITSTRTGGSWTSTTVETTSGQSATGEPASDAGFVVGYWPSLAFDSSGQMGLLHKDAHFGTLQHDDVYRADAEFAWGNGGGFNYEAADIGAGAEEGGQLLFDSEDRPVAAYIIPINDTADDRQGVWAARRETDGTWSHVKLHTGVTGQRVDLAMRTDGSLVASMYSPEEAGVRVRTLDDSTAFTTASAWTDVTVAEGPYDEGDVSAMALLPDGRAVVALHRCRLLTSGSGSCDPSQEAVVVAIEKTDGDGYTYEEVASTDSAGCGDALDVDVDSSGHIDLAWRCTVESGGDYAFRTFHARRQAP